MSACIYCIENMVNGHCYIGQTLNYNARKSKHLSNLRMGNHSNVPLQRAYNKYGEENFIFSILEEVDDYLKIKEREEYWIDLRGYYNIDTGRNGFTPTALRNMSECKVGNTAHRKLKTKEALYILAISDFFDSTARPLGRVIGYSREVPKSLIQRKTYPEVCALYDKLLFNKKLLLFRKALKFFNFNVWSIKPNGNCPLKTRYIRFLIEKTKISYGRLGDYISMTKDGVARAVRNDDREVNTTYNDEQIKQILLVIFENNTVLTSMLEKV